MIFSCLQKGDLFRAALGKVISKTNLKLWVKVSMFLE